MKKILLFAAVLQSFVMYAQSSSNKKQPSGETVFYYYKGEKIYFNTSYRKLIIGFAEGYSLSEAKALLSAASKVAPDSVLETAIRYQYQVKLNELTATERGKAIIASLKDNKKVLYARPALAGIGGKLSSYGNDFIIKLKAATTQLQLNGLLAKYDCKILRPYKFDNRIFIIGAGAANNYDALKMANIFYESGLFEYAEPDFEIYDAIETPPNDPLYYLQWNLKNTGSAAQYSGVPGADINLDSAWTITKGKSTIKVAVIDEGVDTGQVDLKANLIQGFDCLSLTSNPGDGRPLSLNGAHGTCCAGIIAAVADNGIGVAGIAPNCKIMPVNLANSSGYFTTYSNIAAGFDYAWMNGADVLSNSWGGGSPSSTLDDAIYRAITQGRGGKGCVILFSSGNNNAGLSYPALNNNVLAVGGINMCNQRKNPNSCDGEDWWGASYGEGLDIVAPCVKIPSTDITGSRGYNKTGDYYNIFNGTSSACPNAAGVAALVLSVKATYTHDEVKTIMENTADKIPGYTFKLTAGNKNGTWNNELGYGRVDAYQAVLAAKNGKFCGAEITALSQTRFCSGDSVTIKIVEPVNTATYKWYLDGNVLATNVNNIIAKESGAYSIQGSFANGCKASSAAIVVSAVKSKKKLVASAGAQDISLCKESSGARIGGMYSASGGTPFLNEKRAYSMDWYTNNFYRYSLTQPSKVDTIASNVVSSSDLSNGYFFAGGDFTPYGYYALTRLSNKLIRIDTANGSQEFIKQISPSNGEWAGLSWDPNGNQLYALASFGTQSGLYKVDLITGDIEFVATIPIYYLIWIAFNNDGDLYALSIDYDRIYKINKATGAATALPNIADDGFSYAQDADFDPISDSLYLTAFTSRQNSVGDLRLANTSTGTVSTVGLIGLTPYNEMDATGIAGYTYKYSWSPVKGLSNPNDANPIANPSKNTTYTLTVTDMCGKQATSKIKVLVKASKPPVKITGAKDTVCNGKKVNLSATADDSYTYQWYLNGLKITGATDSVYQATAAGSYKVRVSYDTGGCDSLSKAFVLNACTLLRNASYAVAGKTSDGLYKLFPNPAKNVITITLPKSMQASVITVFDMEGKTVISKNLNSTSGTEQLNISRLAAGTYRVLWQQDGQQYSWKFVKQ